MVRLVLIIIIALFAEPVFSQKNDVKSGTIKVVKKKYRVRRIYPVEVNNSFFSGGPERKLVVVNLDGRHGFYPISVQELMLQGKLYVNSDEYQVVSFDLACRVSGIEVVESSESNQFSENQKKLAGLVRRGMRMYIENIKCKNADGMIRDVGSITIVVSSINIAWVLPDPFLIASVSGIYGVGVLRIKKADLLNAKRIDLADPSSKIVGFSFSCEYNGVKLVERSGSDEFTPKMKKIISKIRTGSEVKLLQVRYSSEDGAIKNYGNLLFSLVK